MTPTFFRDKTGQIVLWQWPNLPLLGWGLFALLSQIARWHQLAAVSTACLLVWALMEIFQGVNYFRRLLGLAILVLTLRPFIT
jgi:hypothetical protein